MTMLKSFAFNYTDLAFMRNQIGFRPLFDANGNAIVAWNGSGEVYDARGNVIWNGSGMTATEAVAAFGTSFSSYTASQGIRNVDGLANNLFNPEWGSSDLPFLQRTKVIFDNYVKPLDASSPDAYYAAKFAAPPNPAAADYTKTAANLTNANVVDYTPRMISRTVTTAGVTFESRPGSTHLVKDANGFTSVTDYGMLQSLGQQDTQPSFNADGSANSEWFIGATNAGVAPVNGWFVLFGQFFDHGLDFVGKGGDGTKITINLAPDDPMYGVIDPTSGKPATKIVVSRANVSGFTPDGTPQWVNHTSPYIDQGQTYGSQPSLTAILREWVQDPVSGEWKQGMSLLDGHTSREWTNAWGQTTTATLPTLNELRAHLIATGRDDLTWEDVQNLRARDVHGHVIDSDASMAGVQATGTGAALLLDMNPRFDAAHFANPLNPDAGAAFSADIATLADAAQQLGCTFGYDSAAGTIFLDVPAGMMGPGSPAAQLTGASALYFWVNFGDFSIKTSMQFGPSITPVDPAVHDAVSDLLLAAVGDHYIAGDGRANENIGLTAVHHVFHEEHNFQVQNIIDAIYAQDAREVALDENGNYKHAVLHDWQVNTGSKDASGNYIYANGAIAWDQEKVFQAAKMTVEMEYQHTAVDQFARTITPNLPEFVGYNSGENATISLDFSQVAYRFGHSTLRESIDHMDPNGSLTGAVTRLALEQAFLSPEKFADVGAGALALGMTHQQANESDEFLTPALNQGLLGQPLDLAAINLARGRDLGIPTLNDMREALQLTAYTSWADFGANMIHPDNLVNFIAAYSFDGDVARAQVVIDLGNDVPVDSAANRWGYTIQQAVDFLNNTDASLVGVDGFDKIDCWLGGLAEVHVTGGLLGETFDTIFVDQIGRLMDGDRFYYLQRLSNINYGQEIIDEQFKDIIERTTGITHLNGSAFSYADQYLDLAAQADVNAKTEHKYGAQLAANPTLGIFSDGGTTTGLNGNIVTIGGKQYIRDSRTPDADTKAGNAAGFALDGAPNSGAESHEVIIGANRNDLIYGRGGDDTVYGEDGKDVIYGGGGIDRLYGGDGEDTIYGGDGGDLIDGGNGDDVLFGEQSATAAAGVDQLVGSDGNDYLDGGVGIDKLSGGAGDDVIFGGGDTDPFTHGGDGNDYIDGGVSGDLLWGDGGSDLIVGQADQDVVAGMNGDDILRPGPLSQSQLGGGDEVMGGDGLTDNGENGHGTGFDLIDLSDWQAAPVGAKIDFATQQNPALAIDGNPQFPAWVGIEGAIGSRNDDTFLGDANSNWLIGGSGNDQITGGGGNDLIVGDGIRLDLLIGAYASSYSDMFDGASHRAIGFLQHNGLLDAVGWGDQKHLQEMLKSAMFKDMVLGGSDITKIWRNGVAQTTGESAGQIGDGGVTGSADVAIFSGLRSEYQVSAVFFDVVTRAVVSSPTATAIMAFKITDTVVGRDGQDTVVGVEQFRFSNGAGGVVNFSAAQLVPFPATGNAIISDTTPTEGQVLSVNTSTIADVNGLGPFSYQWQGSSNGTSWTNIDGATSASLAIPDAPGTGIGALADQMLRVIVSFVDGSGHPEAITSAATTPVGVNYDASASANRVNFTGSRGDNIILGSNFNDTLSGAGGNDVINAGGGNDRINASVNDGNDQYDGGAGVDTYSLSTTTADATVDLQLGVASSAQTGNDTIVNFEDVIGGSGNDTLKGVSGSTLTGGAGNDTYIVDTLNVTITENAAQGTDTVRTSLATYNLGANIESLEYAGVAAFAGTGNALNNTITGGVGADTLNGGQGDDILIGGRGGDTLNGQGGNADVAAFTGLVTDYAITGTATTVSVTDVTMAAPADVDTVTNTTEILRMGGVDYTIVRGTGNPETITNNTRGPVLSQALFGLGSADTLNGGTASDILVGGGGADTINGGGGDDFIFQGTGTVGTLAAAFEGRDIVSGGTGTDTYILNGTSSAETYTIMARANAVALGLTLNAATEIVIFVNGTASANIVAELNGIEEIKVNSKFTGAGDTFNIVGNFAPTSLAQNTIRIAGSTGNDTLNISGLTSSHRVVFDSNGGADTLVGTARPQDIITGVPGVAPTAIPSLVAGAISSLAASSIPTFSASDLHLNAGAGVESDFQLMELLNHTNVLTASDLGDHFTALQSGHEMIGIDMVAHADLLLSTRDLLSGMDTTGDHQVSTDYSLLHL